MSRSTMKRSAAISLALITLAGTALALAQPERSGQPGRRGGDPAQFVDRLMQQDANGDGKLSRDEMPENIANRLFESGDTNADGFLDREELLAAMSRRTGQGQPQGRGEAGGGRPGFEASMKNVERALRGLKRSPFTSESMARDLQIVQVLQQSLLGAKGSLSESPQSERAKERFESDDARQRAMRMAFLGALRESLALEMAILEGKEGEAAAILERLEDIEHRGHEMFQPEDDDHDEDDADEGRGRRRDGGQGGGRRRGGGRDGG